MSYDAASDGQTDIVVVDDNENVRDYINEEQEDLESQYNANIMEILENYKQFEDFADSGDIEQVEGVILDLMMPYNDESKEENRKGWLDFLEVAKYAYEVADSYREEAEEILANPADSIMEIAQGMLRGETSHKDVGAAGRASIKDRMVIYKDPKTAYDEHHDDESVEPRYSGLRMWGSDQTGHGTRARDLRRAEELLRGELSPEEIDNFSHEIGYLGGREHQNREVEGEEELQEAAEEVREGMIETAPFGVFILEELVERDKSVIMATDTNNHSTRGAMALAYLGEFYEEERGDLIRSVRKDGGESMERSIGHILDSLTSQ